MYISFLIENFQHGRAPFQNTDALTIEKACDELSKSIRLRKLLGIVLNIGNRLNTAGPGSGKGKAGAITLDSLLKLNQAKAVGDKKLSFLHYVVMVVRRNKDDLLHFQDDLRTVFKADKINWDLAKAEIVSLEKQLISLHEIALQLVPGPWNLNRSNMQNLDPGKEASILSETSTGRFFMDASFQISDMCKLVQTTSKKFTMLLEYFGEDKNDTQPHELFKIMITFCKNFQSAVEDIERMEKAKVRS